MTRAEAEAVIQKTIKDVFGIDYTMSFDEALGRFGYGIRLPNEVNCALTGVVTWAGTLGTGKKYATYNALMEEEVKHDWMYPKEEITSIEQLQSLANRANYIASERMLESDDVGESDTIYGSQHVFRSQDVHGSQHVVLCDGTMDSEYVVACERSNNLNFCIKVIDSKDCSSSFNVDWSAKIAKSMFITDSKDLFECLFCSHIASKQYCIANMQYTEEEYFKIKKSVIEWLFPKK